MTLPGPVVTIIDSPPPAGTSTDTGTGFMVGFADRGPVAGAQAPSDVLTSKAAWDALYGARQSYNGPEADAVEGFFADGGSRLFYSRKVGLAPVAASASIPTVSPKFTAAAKYPGVYGNGLTVEVTSSVITVKEGTTTREVSPTLADVAAAQAWAATSSSVITITPVGSGALTNSAAVPLAGGTDDRTNITDAQIQAAIDRFGKDLGPGQVALPGDGRQQAWQILAQHCLDKNRRGVPDAPDAASDATVTAVAATLRALGRDLARQLVPQDPWVTAPPLTAGGAPRVVPPCFIYMAAAARSDAATGNPNRALAGANGISSFATGVKYVRDDAARGRLADAGVNVIRVIDNAVQIYDDVTLVDPTTDPEWLGAAGNRMVMRIVLDAQRIAGAHMFRQNSGPDAVSAYNGDLTGMLAGWLRDRALWSDDGSAAGAFSVKTGPPFNTTATAQARVLGAGMSFHLSPNNRQVTVVISNRPLTETL